VNIRNDFSVPQRHLQASRRVLPFPPTPGAMSAGHVLTHPPCLNVPYLYAGHPQCPSVALCSHYYVATVLTYPPPPPRLLSICRMFLVPFYLTTTPQPLTTPYWILTVHPHIFFPLPHTQLLESLIACIRVPITSLPFYSYNSFHILKSILLLTNHSLFSSTGIRCAIPSISAILII